MFYKVYSEDCLNTLERSDLEFDYVFTSPPDFSELGMDVETDSESYLSFLDSVFESLTQKCSLITIINTDRKANSRVTPKHILFHNLMQKKGFDILTYKIWCKSIEPKINLYRMGYAHIITYAKQGAKISQNNFKLFQPDAYFTNHRNYKGYSFGNPEVVAEFHIRNFMQEGMVFYDPFCGSGTNLVVAKRFGFSCVGSEINEQTAELCRNRLESATFPLLSIFEEL